MKLCFYLLTLGLFSCMNFNTGNIPDTTTLNEVALTDQLEAAPAKKHFAGA